MASKNKSKLQEGQAVDNNFVGFPTSTYDYRDYDIRYQALKLALNSPELIRAQQGILPLAAIYYNFLKGGNEPTNTNRGTEGNTGS